MHQILLVLRFKLQYLSILFVGSASVWTCIVSVFSSVSAMWGFLSASFSVLVCCRFLVFFWIKGRSPAFIESNMSRFLVFAGVGICGVCSLSLLGDQSCRVCPPHPCIFAIIKLKIMSQFCRKHIANRLADSIELRSVRRTCKVWLIHSLSQGYWVAKLSLNNSLAATGLQQNLTLKNTINGSKNTARQIHFHGKTSYGI
jgi:hypothetical protein